MPGIVLIGAQWGDEGKGKATDLIGTKVDYVARFNGGNNAGHTVVVGDESYALHLLPSGIISPTATPVIGNGVVVDPEVLFQEIDGLESRGVDCSRLLVSEGAHIIAPYHRVLDKVILALRMPTRSIAWAFACTTCSMLSICTTRLRQACIRRIRCW